MRFFKLKFVQFLAINAIVVLVVLISGITHASTSIDDKLKEEVSGKQMNLIVKHNTLYVGEKEYHCAVGRNGVKVDKLEGDGATPAGRFPLRSLWYRQDRLAQPQTKLPSRMITPADGWCDDPQDPLYNRPVILPYNASHEEMWREGHLYDLVIEVGYNDNPPVLGKGSAIFIHIARPGYSPTAGCVALTKEHLLEILPHLSTNSKLIVEEE